MGSMTFNPSRAKIAAHTVFSALQLGLDMPPGTVLYHPTVQYCQLVEVLYDVAKVRVRLADGVVATIPMQGALLPMQNFESKMNN